MENHDFPPGGIGQETSDVPPCLHQALHLLPLSSDVASQVWKGHGAGCVCLAPPECLCLAQTQALRR